MAKQIKLRYFVFFYVVRTGLENVNGVAYFRNESSFPGQRYVLEGIAKHEDYHPARIALTGWNEMSKKDFDSFTEGDI